MSGGPPSRIRVVHVIANLQAGGMEKLLVDLVQRIDANRFESHVLALQYFGRYGPAAGAHASLHLGPPMSRLSLLRPAALARRIAELRPHVVHTHSGVWYKGARAARLAGVRRVVHTEHGVQPEDLVAQFLDRRAARLT